MDRIFQWEAWLAAGLIGLGGGVIALIIRLVKGDGTAAFWRALETFMLAGLGAILARTFISLVLSLGGDSNLAVVATSLLFFIWPGVVNLVSWIFGPPVIGIDALLWIALGVGGAVGLMDGLWAVHRWKGGGAFTFLLDVTWGLGGSTNAALLHLINFAWAGHADDPAGGTEVERRQYAHRYQSGFALKPDFAFTQGACMSNMGSYGPGSDLFQHESIHVWQHRALGPFFWFSYFGWMVVMFVPALIAGAFTGFRRIGDTILWWCYFDNPWEVMAYGIANPTARTGQYASTGGPIEGWLCWPVALALILGVVVVTGLGALFVMLLVAAFF